MATETFFDRLVKEAQELEERIEKLKIFIQKLDNKEAFVSPEQEALLRKQIKPMIEYYKILETRIDKLEKELF